MIGSADSAVREDDLIPLSALQHFLFCSRQCALIHVERQWAENQFTADGCILHDRVDEPALERRAGVRIVRAMPLRSLALGVSGIADVVELRGQGGDKRPYPVEYKRGKPKAHRADEVQLCAQALCLEEMFGCAIPEGALFYGQTRRRQAVPLDAELRRLTTQIATETRALLSGRETPPPVYEPRKCDTCSLIDICKPKQMSRRKTVSAWVKSMLDDG